MIRILLVEPMNLLRGALAATLSLEEDFAVVADLGGLDQALDMARAVPPDVAVVNIALLGGDTEERAGLDSATMQAILRCGPRASARHPQGRSEFCRGTAKGRAGRST